MQHEKDETYVQHEINEQKDEIYVQHEINEQKDKTFNVQIVPNIESSAITKTSANLIINAPNDETFNVQSIILFNIEMNEKFIISWNETFTTENTDTNIDEKDISDAINFSDAIDLSNATDQISDNSPNNQSELATPIASIKRDRDGPCKHSVKVDFISINETSSVASIPYVFNSTIDTKYDSSEFKGLLINSGTTFRSTKNMGQLQTLQHLDPFIKFDTSVEVTRLAIRSFPTISLAP